MEQYRLVATPEGPITYRLVKKRFPAWTVTAAEKPRVELRTFMGGTRLLSMLEGAQLPRIC